MHLSTNVVIIPQRTTTEKRRKYSGKITIKGQKLKQTEDFCKKLLLKKTYFHFPD
jgi:hypothetical protein